MKSDITYRDGSLSSTDRITATLADFERRTGAKPLTHVANPGDLGLDLAKGGGRLAGEAARPALRGRRPCPPDEWAIYDAGSSTSKRRIC